MRAQGVVRADRRGDLLRLLRLRARVDGLPPIAVGPAVEAALAHRGEIIRNEIGTDLVAFVHDRPALARSRLDGERGGVAQTGGAIGSAPCRERVCQYV